MTQKNIQQLTATALIVGIVLAVFIGVKTIDAFQSVRNREVPNTISVTGTGEVFAAPNVAAFSYTAVGEGETVALAQEESAEIANNVLSFLEGEGITEENIKTINYSIDPVFESRDGNGLYIPFEEREIVSYRVRQRVEVKVHETESVGEILSGVGAREVQNLSGLSFTIDDPEVLTNDAREMAIEDAREKAQEIARDLGVRLGDVAGFYVNTDGYPPIYYETGSRNVAFDVAEEAAVPEIPMGENEVQVQVEIVYEIH